MRLMKKLNRVNHLFSSIFLWVFSGLVFADAEHHGIAHVAEKIIFGAEFVTRLLMVICFVIGVGFIIMAITHYKSHRFNPKLVPLGKPVMYFVLGLLVMAIPFLERIFGGTGNPFELKKKKTEEVQVHDIDAPLR